MKGYGWALFFSLNPMKNHWLMKFAPIFAALFACASTGFSQGIEATTEDGRKVLLNSDGTWRYVGEQPSDDKPSVEPPVIGDCSTYIEMSEDNMTGRVSISAPVKPIVASKDGDNGLVMYWLLLDKTLVLVLKAYGGGCIDDDGLVNFLFRDGSRMELRHNSDFNCDQEADLWFGGMYGKKRELDLLSSKEVAAIRVHTMKSFVQEELSDEQSLDLLNSLKCIKEKMR